MFWVQPLLDHSFPILYPRVKNADFTSYGYIFFLVLNLDNKYI